MGMVFGVSAHIFSVLAYYYSSIEPHPSEEPWKLQVNQKFTVAGISRYRRGGGGGHNCRNNSSRTTKITIELEVYMRRRRPVLNRVVPCVQPAYRNALEITRFCGMPFPLWAVQYRQGYISHIPF